MKDALLKSFIGATIAHYSAGYALGFLSSKTDHPVAGGLFTALGAIAVLAGIGLPAYYGFEAFGEIGFAVGSTYGVFGAISLSNAISDARDRSYGI